MMPVTASDKQTYQEKFAPEIAVRTSMADFKKEDKLVDLPLYAIEQIAELLVLSNQLSIMAEY